MEDMRKISRLSNYTINDITAVWGDQEEGDQEEGDQEERRERRQALYHDVQELCLGRSSDPTRTLTLLRWVLPIKSDRKRPSVVVVLGGQTTVEFGHNSTTAPLSFDPPMNGPMSRFYKESLKDVLMPTLKSVMRSRNHYIAMGNTQGLVSLFRPWTINVVNPTTSTCWPRTPMLSIKVTFFSRVFWDVIPLIVGWDKVFFLHSSRRASCGSCSRSMFDALL